MTQYRVNLSDVTINEMGVEVYELTNTLELRALIDREGASDPSYVLARPAPMAYPCLMLVDRESALPSPEDDVEALLLGNIFIYDYDVV